MTGRTRLVALVVAFLAVPVTARAVPERLSYSGYLTTGAGEPIHCEDPADCLTMTFLLYADAEGGAPLWSEVIENVMVQGGAFDVLLGDQVPLDGGVFGDGPLWIALRIGENEEMRPRQPVVSTPYALLAGEAETCRTAEALGPEALAALTPRETLAAHAADAAAHHARYTDAEARASVAALLGDYATVAALAAHTDDTDVHHARYTDDEARAAGEGHFATVTGLEAHAGDAALHPARYTDDEARAAVAALLGDYALARDYLAHAEDPAAHHPRYTDDEAVAAVTPLLFSGDYEDLAGSPDLSVYTTHTEQGAHAADPAAHHPRYTDDEAVAAVTPYLFSGRYTDLAGPPDLTVYATVVALTTHTGNATLHHARYTDAEARAAVAGQLDACATDSDLVAHAGDGTLHFSGDYRALSNKPDLGLYTTFQDLQAHSDNSEAHHTRYSDAEARAAVTPLLFSGDYRDLAHRPPSLTPRQLALKRWYPARRLDADVLATCATGIVAMESDGDAVYVLCGDNRVFAHDAATGAKRWEAAACQSAPAGLALDGRYVWAACGAGRLYGMKATDGTQFKTYNVNGSNLRGVTFDGTYLWVADVTLTRLAAIHAFDGTKGPEPVTDGAPGPVAFDGTNVWTITASRSLQIIRVSDGAVVTTLTLDRGGAVGLVWTGTHMWATFDDTAGNDALQIFEPSGTRASIATLGANGPGQPAFDGRRVYVPANLGRNLYVFDAVALTQLHAWTLPTGRTPRVAAFDGAHVWIGESASTGGLLLY